MITKNIIQLDNKTKIQINKFMDIKIITFDWNYNLKITKAEKQKTKLENENYNLLLTITQGTDKSIMVYKKEN